MMALLNICQDDRLPENSALPIIGFHVDDTGHRRWLWQNYLPNTFAELLILGSGWSGSIKFWDSYDHPPQVV